MNPHPLRVCPRGQIDYGLQAVLIECLPVSVRSVQDLHGALQFLLKGNERSSHFGGREAVVSSDAYADMLETRLATEAADALWLWYVEAGHRVLLPPTR